MTDQEVRPRWWSGVLDVEGLAMDALRAVCSAIARIAKERGQRVDVRTSPELIAASYAAIGHLRVSGRPAAGWAPYSGFFQAQDGWVRLHGNYPHHAVAIARALGVGSKGELVRVVAGLLAAEVERSINEAGGVATVVRTEDEWSAHPHGQATADEPWHTTVTGGTRTALGKGDLPLAGVRVLDLTRVVAGPTCSQLLACLGGDVLRIDPPRRPELLDQYLSNGMGKRSVELDLREEAARVRGELLPQADIVLLGYRPGALARYGLDAEALAADHPHLVIGCLSAWGEQGPWGHRPGFDSIVQAATGIAHVCADDNGQPGALPVQALDHSTGHVLAAGVITLLARGYGGVVRASLLGAARDLLTRPRSTAAAVDLDVPTVTVGSPYGELTTVPPPVMLDGQYLHRAVAGYGAARPGWA